MLGLPKKTSKPEFEGTLPRTKAEREIAKQMEEALDGDEMRNMDDTKRKQIADLLDEHGLAIDEPRGLEYRCHFKPIFIPGLKTKTQEDLERFLDTNQVGHLAIYSVERHQEGLACFYIEDLIKLLKYRSRSATDADLQKLTEEYWDDSNIRAGGVTLDGGEVVRAIEWGAAYSKLKELITEIANDMDDDQFRSLMKVSTAIVPKKRVGRYRRLINWVKRTTRYIWEFIAMKLVADLLANVLCVLVLYFVWTSHGLGLTELMWNAFTQWLYGNVMMFAYVKINELVQQYLGSYLSAIWEFFLTLLRNMGFQWLLEVCVNVFASIVTVRQGSALVAGVAFAGRSVLTNMIVSGVMSVFTGAGFMAGATVAFSSWGLFAVALGAVFVAGNKWAGHDVDFNMMPHLGANTGVIGATLLLLSSDKVCQILQPLGKRSVRMCNQHFKRMLRNALTSSIILAVVDVLVLLMRTQNPGFLPGYPKTRCELQFNDLIEQKEQKVQQKQKTAQTELLKANEDSVEALAQITEKNMAIERLLKTKPPSKEFDAELNKLHTEIAEITQRYKSNRNKMESIWQNLEQSPSKDTIEKMISGKIEQLNTNISKIETENSFTTNLSELKYLKLDRIKLQRMLADHHLLNMDRDLMLKNSYNPEHIEGLRGKIDTSASDLKKYQIALTESLPPPTKNKEPDLLLEQDHNLVQIEEYKAENQFLKKSYEEYNSLKNLNLNQEEQDTLKYLHMRLTAWGKLINSLHQNHVKKNTDTRLPPQSATLRAREAFNKTHEQWEKFIKTHL